MWLKKENLDDYKTDHLIVLVGGNPLPNAVAVNTLLKSNGTLWLIRSKDTETVANNLAVFAGVDSDHYIQKEVQPYDPTSIHCSINDVLDSIKNDYDYDITIGLHYTGGTKVMSAFARDAVSMWAKNKPCKVIYSYLDASGLCLVIDPDDVKTGQRLKYRPKTELAVKTILNLHAIEPISSKYKFNPDPVLPESASALAQMYKDKNGGVCYNKWKTGWKSKYRRTKPRSDVTLADMPVCNLREALMKECQLNDYCNCTLGDIAKSMKNITPESFYKWMNGGWLEQYALHSLIRGAVEEKLVQSWAQSLETVSPHFELDLVAVSGYQLFAFSCTCIEGTHMFYKHKLFECYVRARQLGGDEARVALICPSDNPKGLEEEMLRQIDSNGRLKIFGREVFDCLGDAIAEWIEMEATP